ncbi:MAG: acyl-ACP--UDP-N-acetylglucosamine O-acyltransferase [Pirellulales bacterium]
MAAGNHHPMASIDPRAELDEDVEVGPFCVVGPQVRIGRGTRLDGGVHVMGRVTIGEFNRFYPGAVIGAEPQDLGFSGGDTQVIIGDHNVFREGVTVNRATEKEEGRTVVGSHNFLMANCHVAHDCKLGNRVVMANGTLLAGHVHVNDHAAISGNCAIHQFATIGEYAYVAGLARVMCDLPPYMLAEGYPARPRCVNAVALKRNDFDNETIKALNEAYRLIYRARVGLDHVREILRGNDQLVPQVNHLLLFVQAQQEGRHGRGREGLRRAA